MGSLVHPLLVVLSVVATLAVFQPSAARSIDLSAVDIITFEQRVDGGSPEYFLEIEVGDNDLQLSSGTVTAPITGEMIVLEPDLAGGPGRLQAVVGPFASLAALRALYPLGAYSFLLQGGSVAGSLNYSPSDTNGFVSIFFPLHLSTGVSSQPTFQFSNSCTNCQLIFFNVQTPSTSFESEDLAPTATMYTFPAPFEDGVHTADAATGLAVETTPSFGGDFFQYDAISGTANQITFTVPEPSWGLQRLAALGALVVISRTSRRRCPSGERRSTQ
jgi:hypothetical protein